jgi:hypothetical protein
VLELIYDSRNSKKSSSSAPENISSSSTYFDQDQEQLSVQKEKVKYVSMGKPNYPVFQIGVSGFDRMETSLVEEKDCPCQVSTTTMMMMTLTMMMIMKSSC